MVWQDVGHPSISGRGCKATFHSTIVEHGEVLIENSLFIFSDQYDLCAPCVRRERMVNDVGEQ